VPLEEARAALKRLNAELEDRVAQRTRELREANQELETFSYTVAHDLRSPLLTINGFASLLRGDDTTPAAQRDAMLDRITGAAQRMGRQIEGLLALSKLSRAEMRFARTDLSALAAGIVAELRQQHPGRAVEVEVAQGLVCHGDATLLQVVLQNLLGNAWKYTGRTIDPVIRFEARQQEGETEYCVADNGAGFDMQYAGRLFEAFQRMHRQEDFPGAGIGLATVRRIVERHGGRIRAASSPGAGARFFFTLGSARATP
jgi:light-regulated signal transduction histidine kinase (bacteriophytochrome)